MGGIVNTAVDMLKKLSTFVFQYTSITTQWTMKTLKVQFQKGKKCGVQKKVVKAYSGLGGEIFALHKEGQKDWADVSTVKEQLKLVEQAEALVFSIDQTITTIQNEFQETRKAVAEKYASQRAHIGQPES